MYKEIKFADGYVIENVFFLLQVDTPYKRGSIQLPTPGA
jgi:hypothetical protein